MENTISRRDFLKSAGAGTASLALLGLLPGTALAEEEVLQEEEGNVLDKEIYCIDRFVTLPGEGKEFLSFYLEGYRNKAEAYGMTLKSTLVSPPVWLNNAPNTIEVTWGISGFNGWAAMVNASRYDEETLAWWREIRTKVLEQDRSYYAKEEDMEGINNV